MPDLRIETGGLEVIGSGIVTAYRDNSIEITIVPSTVGHTQEGSLSFIFNFEEDGGEPHMETTQVSDNTMELLIYNQRSSGVRMGGVGPPVGPFEPILIGQYSGRELLCIYQLQTRDVDDIDFILTHLYYTFYLGDSIDESGE